MQVRCYFNLHRKVWSVQCAKTRRIIGHADRILLRDVTFKVSEAGRQRVLREGRKNVHAFACGTLEAAAWDTVTDEQRRAAWCLDWGVTLRANNAYAKAAERLGVRATYNPRFHSTFMRLSPVDGQHTGPMHEAAMVLLDCRMTRRTILAFDPCWMTWAESAAATE